MSGPFSQCILVFAFYVLVRIAFYLLVPDRILCSGPELTIMSIRAARVIGCCKAGNLSWGDLDLSAKQEIDRTHLNTLEQKNIDRSAHDVAPGIP